MSIGHKIDKALTAHSVWKAQLRAAIDSRRLETLEAALQNDDQCTFGRWLRGSDLSPEEKSSPDYERVFHLHAQFHEAAALAARQALAGERAEAERTIAGEFSEVSRQLTGAMTAWKKSVDR